MNKDYIKLQSLYKKIPDIQCKGLCHETCSNIPVSKIEKKRIRENTGFTFKTSSQAIEKLFSSGESSSCKALKDGRCTIYQNRPAICRGYGVAEGLECHFGCKPKDKLSRNDFHDILTEINNI